MCLDGSSVVAVLREVDRHLARLELADRTRRIVFDATRIGLRVEIDARAYRFGWETTGRVHAATPGVVTAVHVAAGERVQAGQVLGFLEAMKMEVAFTAAVDGVVTEVAAATGQRVAAGDVLVTIDPAASLARTVGAARIAIAGDLDPPTPLLAARVRSGCVGRWRLGTLEVPLTGWLPA